MTLKAKIISILLLIAVFYFGFTTIQGLNQQIGKLEADNQAFQASILALSQSYDKLNSDVSSDLDEQQRFNKQLRDLVSSNTKQSSELKDMFDKNSKDTNANISRLERLLNEKPSLMEKRINDATQKVFDELEEISDYEN